MQAFITGGGGFVGGWLIRHLEASGDTVVVGEADVTDGAALAAELVAARPDAVYHLAALSHVGRSWDAPVEVFTVNATGTLHLLEAAQACAVPPRVLLISSAEVYGPVEPHEVPLTEDRPLRPATPYAASKVAAEYLGVQAHLGRGLPVIRARSFNHAGPGQAPDFLVPALARRIADAERTGAPAITVGNLSARRDFTDVRDVVRAYRLLVERGRAGEVYNVCSGVDRGIDEVVGRIVELSGAGVALEIDPALVRPVDIPVLRGDNRRLREVTGWVPEHELDRTLSDVLAEARAAVAG